MKKIILFLFAVMSLNMARAQGGTVYDNLFLGNVGYSSLCNQAWPGYHWAATHGSPTYYELNTSIYMWSQISGKTYGEGVCKSYGFSDNTFYQVTLGIIEFKQNTTASGTGDFVVLLTNDPLSSFQACNSGGGASIPSFSNSRVLYNYHGNNSYGDGDFLNKRLQLNFFLYPGESYDKIVIYPKQLDFVGVNTDLTIDYLNIFNCSKASDNYFCDIDPGEYFQASAYIGSTHCNNLPQFTLNNPYETTLIHAKYKVEINENTDISISSRGSEVVILDIVDCPVGHVDFDPENPPDPDLGPAKYQFFDEENEEEETGGKPSRPTSDKIPSMEGMKQTYAGDLVNGTKSFDIHPNPAKNNISIDYYVQQDSKLDVKIRDLSGRVFMTKSIGKMAIGSHEINLDISSLINGIYLIEITTDYDRSISKFVVQH